jgi:hypothetical protein
LRKHFTTLQGFHLKEEALKMYSGQGAVRTALCLAQGIEAESPDDDRREEEDLQRKARPPRGAGVAPKCVDGYTAFFCFNCGGPDGTDVIRESLSVSKKTACFFILFFSFPFSCYFCAVF